MTFISRHLAGKLTGTIAALSLLLVGCGLDTVAGPADAGPTASPAPTSTASSRQARTSTPQDPATPSPGVTTPESTPSTPEPTVTPSPEATATAPPEPTGTSSPEATATASPEPTGSPSPTATPNPSPGADEAEDPDDNVLRHGDSGQQVVAIQERLADLGYWLGPVDGNFGDLTEQAVLAFQGWEQITRDGIVGPETRAHLADATRPTPVTGGDLTEVHRDRGVLLVVRDGATHLALHVSTGSNETYQHPAGHEAVADTPPGTWTVTWQVDGIRQGSLGSLYRPKYFHEDGIAIHGFEHVPAWPASHGCVRVSKPAMDMLWADGLVPVGSTVVVV